MFYYKKIANKIYCLAEDGYTITTNGSTYTNIEISNATGTKTINNGVEDIDISISSFPMPEDRFLILNGEISNYWKTNIQIDDLDNIVSTVNVNGYIHTGYSLVYKITESEPTLIVGNEIENGLYYAIKYFEIGTEHFFMESLIWEKNTGSISQTIVPTTPRGNYGIKKEDDTTTLNYTILVDILTEDVLNNKYYKNDDFIINSFPEDNTYDGNTKEFLFTTKRNFKELCLSSSYSNVEWIIRTVFSTDITQTFHKVNSTEYNHILTSTSYIEETSENNYLVLDSFNLEIIPSEEILSYSEQLGLIITRNSNIESEVLDISDISEQLTHSGEYSFGFVNKDREGNLLTYNSDSDQYVLVEDNPRTPLRNNYGYWETIFTIALIEKIKTDFRILNNFIYISILNKNSYAGHKIEILDGGTILNFTTKQNMILSSIQESYDSSTYYDDSTIIPNILMLAQFTDVFRCSWLDGKYENIDAFNISVKVLVNGEYREIYNQKIDLLSIESDIGALLRTSTPYDIEICPLHCTLKSDTIGDDNVIQLEEDIKGLYDFNGITDEYKSTNKINSIDKLILSDILFKKDITNYIENEWLNKDGTISFNNSDILALTLSDGEYSINMPYTDSDGSYLSLDISVGTDIIMIGQKAFPKLSINIIIIYPTFYSVNGESFVFINAELPTQTKISFKGRIYEIRQYGIASIEDIISIIWNNLSLLNGIRYPNDDFTYVDNDTFLSLMTANSNLYASVSDLNKSNPLEEVTGDYVTDLYITYGKIQKINMYRKYHLYTRQCDKRIEFNYNSCITDYMSPTSLEQQNYLSYGTFAHSKSYSYKIFMQQGQINHITIPLSIKNISGTDYLVYDKDNKTPTYVGLIYLKEDYTGNENKYYELLSATSIYSKTLPPTNTQLCVWGEEFVKITESLIPIYDIEEPNLISSSWCDARTILSELSICFNKQAFEIKTFSLETYITRPAHIPFEYIRSVVDISDLVIGASFSNKMISAESNPFEHQVGNGNIDISDDFDNWNKFNLERKYKPKKNDRVFLFEGNIENYFLSNTAVINETIVDIDKVVLNTYDVLSSLKTIECVVLGNIEEFHKHYYFNSIIPNTMSVYTNENFGEIISQINSVGLKTTMLNNDKMLVVPLTDKIINTHTDLTNSELLNVSVNTREVINKISLNHTNRFPISKKLEPIQITINHTLMSEKEKFNLIEVYTSFDSFDRLLLKAGDRCVLQYQDYEFNCKIVDLAIDPNMPKKVKISISAGYDTVNYFDGYYEELYPIFKEEKEFKLNLGVEYDQVVYQLQTKDKYTSLGIPLLPQESLIVTAKLSSPESDLFTYSGYINRQEEYYGEIKIPSKRFFYDVSSSANVVDSNFEVSKIREIQDIDGKYYANYTGNLKFTAEKDDDIKLIFTNPDEEEIGFTITPLSVAGAIMFLNIDDYDKVEVGNVLKIDPVYQDVENDLYGTYIVNKNIKYKILGKFKEGVQQYISLSSSYPSEKNRQGKYCIPSVYTNYTKIDHFELRANSLVDSTEIYELKNASSVQYYGEKSMSINNTIIDWKTIKNNVAYIMDTMTGGSDGNEYVDKLPTIIKFSLHKDFLLNVGDLIRAYSSYLSNEYLFMIVEKTIKLGSADEFVALILPDKTKYDSLDLTTNSRVYFTKGFNFVSASELRVLGDTLDYGDTIIVDATYDVSLKLTKLDGDWECIDTTVKYQAVGDDFEEEINIQYEDYLYTNTRMYNKVGLYPKSQPVIVKIPQPNTLYIKFPSVPQYIKVIGETELYNNTMATEVFTVNYGVIPIEIELPETYTVETESYRITIGDKNIIKGV